MPTNVICPLSSKCSFVVVIKQDSSLFKLCKKTSMYLDVCEFELVLDYICGLGKGGIRVYKLCSQKELDAGIGN